jgi:polyisoprenoid-binding protein YceI
MSTVRNQTWRKFMNISRCLLVAAIALSASPIFAASQGADVAKIEKGTYVADPSHTAVAARINHLGFSQTTLRFAKAGGNSRLIRQSPKLQRWMSRWTPIR